MAIAWVTVLAFVRISTSPRVFEQPLLASEALAAVASWLERPSHHRGLTCGVRRAGIARVGAALPAPGR